MPRASTSPHTRVRKRLFRAALAGLIMAPGVCAAPAAQACGYHSPESLALGGLNLAFPKALYVRTAVWQAEDSGVLPPRNPEQVRDPFAYLKMVAHLQTFGARLSAAKGDTDLASFSVVLIDSMLWVRFAATSGGYVVRPHVDGSEKGDVVIVTDGKVIKALVEGSLAAAGAETHGLYRLYGAEDSRSKVRSALIETFGVAKRTEEPSK